MGRRGYPSEFRRKVLDLAEAGRKVTDVAHDLDISSQTICSWRRQEQIVWLLRCAPIETELITNARRSTPPQRPGPTWMKNWCQVA
ncbi:transposase [Streptosporangium sp. G11]|uniref:transposase n=1 Tax=Streptosporangium sp. G11 TaxID=3436926 RepID=UPI003EB92BDE